jgi:hypothetical protein
MSSEKKTWKDHLLSSGLPLEQSVIRDLKSIGIIDPREYKYERLNENGVPTVFSVDIQATMINGLTNGLWMEFFVECKYRHDNTKWIFTPTEYSEWRDDAFQDAFIILDDLTDLRVDHNYINKFASKYPLCNKGIEIFNNDANPKSIEQAIHQLKFALVDATAESLQEQTENFTGSKNPIFVFIPLIVTTAEIWRLNPKTTIEMIREANELTDVAKPHKYILVQQNPDNELERHTLKLFNGKLGDAQIENFNSQKKGVYQNYQHFVNHFAAYYPSYYFVIQYQAFLPTIKKLISMFKNKSARQKNFYAE